MYRMYMHQLRLANVKGYNWVMCHSGSHSALNTFLHVRVLSNAFSRKRMLDVVYFERHMQCGDFQEIVQLKRVTV